VSSIVAIYTGHGVVDAVRAECKAALGEASLANIVDDSLLRDVRDAGGLTPAVSRRLVQYFMVARDMGADVILNTCSSVGEVIPGARALLDVPIVRIDEPMARLAVERATRIGVLATLPTTLGPTVRLVRSSAAELGCAVTVEEGLAAGAYDALVAGKPEEHDRLLLETASRLGPRVEILVLAQASMARIASRLEQAAGLPVLSSIRPAVAEIARLLAGGKDA
jgi:Asp/Glu/hydantoin racemase